MIDLHAHTTASDGSFTPSELAVEAKLVGLEACAITDHDTVAGVAEFIAECERLGIEGVPGVELSAKFRTQMHIVGLYVDYTDEKFLGDIHAIENGRDARNREMLKRFVDAGFDITVDELLAFGEGDAMDNIGRPHFARVLLEKEYVRSIDEAFDKYLNECRPFYAERKRFGPKETIETIKNAGGAAILAHPCYISSDPAEIRELAKELKGYGLDGMECRYSRHSEEYAAAMSEICDELGLIKSGGSDFHGSNKPDIALGYGVIGKNDINVPYEYLENIKKDLTNAHKRGIIL